MARDGEEVCVCVSVCVCVCERERDEVMLMHDNGGGPKLEAKHDEREKRDARSGTLI